MEGSGVLRSECYGCHGGGSGVRMVELEGVNGVKGAKGEVLRLLSSGCCRMLLSSPCQRHTTHTSEPPICRIETAAPSDIFHLPSSPLFYRYRTLR